MRNYEPNRRVLVTSGAGFLDSHLIDRLLSQGHEVFFSDNLLMGSMRNLELLHLHPRFELVRHDVASPVYVEVDETHTNSRGR